MSVQEYIDTRFKEIMNHGKVKVNGHETTKFSNLVADCRLGMMQELSEELEKHDKEAARKIVKKWQRAFDTLEETIIFGDPP